MFPHYIFENIDILAVMTIRKNNFGFHGNRKTQGHKHQLNNLYFKYQVCQIKLRHLNTFLQFRLFFHEPHCMFPRLHKSSCTSVRWSVTFFGANRLRELISYHCSSYLLSHIQLTNSICYRVPGQCESHPGIWCHSTVV